MLYFARDKKGHDGIKGTVVEDYQGTLVHDHDVTFYKYGTGHQECLAHVLRYLKDSMDNEKDRTWNRQMHSLIQEMIHYRNGLSESEDPDPQTVSEFEERYKTILSIDGDEYDYEPPLKIHGDVYNYNEREYDDDYYSQPGDLFRLMPAEEQLLLFENTARAMGDAELFIKQRHIRNCYKADPAYGTGVAAALGIDLQEALASTK